MSPSLPPLGLPCDTVLVPYAFWFALPNVPVMVLPDIFNPDNVAVAGFQLNCPLSESIYCLLYPALL